MQYLIIETLAAYFAWYLICFKFALIIWYLMVYTGRSPELWRVYFESLKRSKLQRNAAIVKTSDPAT